MTMLRYAVVIACLGLCACQSEADAALVRALTGRGAMACLGPKDFCHRELDGASVLEAGARPELIAALRADDSLRLAASLASAHLVGVLVDARAQGIDVPAHSVAARLARYARVDGFTGVHVSPLASLYALDPTREWSAELRSGVAEVARRLLSGAPEPKLTSFPEVLRRVEPVEVMVLLRSGTRARLWRSARGSSFARALLTAADVARKRWTEREQAMGGPLDVLLPTLTVEVALLVDDGELGARDRSFIDRAVGADHGVAYEQKGAWRYLLPEATHTPARQKPADAYKRLFSDDGLPEDSLGNRELRLYRMAVSTIGTSVPAPVHDDTSAVASPDEVLGK